MIRYLKHLATTPFLILFFLFVAGVSATVSEFVMLNMMDYTADEASKVAYGIFVAAFVAITLVIIGKK